MNNAEELVHILKEQELLIATAESCTGGKVAAEIVSVSGASEVFFEGVVTYSNESKMRRLGVNAGTLNSCGAVSAQTAQEMVLGLLKSPVRVAISTTGVAGPLGGSTQKPVGLVYIGVGLDKEVWVSENHFAGDREAVREQAKDTAILNALSLIKKNLRR